MRKALSVGLQNSKKSETKKFLNLHALKKFISKPKKVCKEREKKNIVEVKFLE